MAPVFHEDYVIIISIAGSFFTALHLFYSIRIAMKRQELAYAGDAVAAKRIILPCYKPFVRGLLLFYLLFAVALALTYVNPNLNVHRLVQYYCFSLLTVYSITPVMLVQSSVSATAFWRTFYTILPYWSFNTMLFGLVDVGGDAALVFRSLFVLFSTAPPLLLAVGILTKHLSSRVQLGSNSNRNATELLLIYALVFGIVFSVGLACDKGNRASNETIKNNSNNSNNDHHYDDSSCSGLCDIIIVSVTFLLNQLFPFALYRTLLADTKFWRGLGTHNQGGLLVDDALRATGVNIHRPTMELAVASSSLQNALAEIHDLTVDFAFLALEQEVGQGATARVFRGRYKKKVVAVKLSTPPEITEEVLETFLKEAKISALFRHRNIVRFLGICVRPPQIGMVFEFCDGGALKSHLQQHPQLWKPALQRLRGCLDMARSLQALHGLGFLHRDIKADNFFVGRKLVVKLGDFGEATRMTRDRLEQLRSHNNSLNNSSNGNSNSNNSSSGYQEYLRRTVSAASAKTFLSGRHSESDQNPYNSNTDIENNNDSNNNDNCNDNNNDTAENVDVGDDLGRRSSSVSSASKRMTILGTVAFMAPELVNNARVYNEKIDIYALGVAFWELWTLGSDPYADLSTFQIYAKVQRGERPALPTDAPLAFQQLLTACWQEQEELRPSAAELVMKLQGIVLSITNGNNNSSNNSNPQTTSEDYDNSYSTNMQDDDDGPDEDDAPRETGFFSSVMRISQRLTTNTATNTNNNSTATMNISSTVNPVASHTSTSSSPGRRGSFLTSLQAAARSTHNSRSSSTATSLSSSLTSANISAAPSESENTGSEMVQIVADTSNNNTTNNSSDHKHSSDDVINHDTNNDSDINMSPLHSAAVSDGISS